MRKYLVAAVAVCLIGSLAAPAVAQTPGATMKVVVKKTKAGTKKKPKDASLKLDITNNDFTQTASRIEIWLGKTIKLDHRGAKKKCSINKLSNGGPSACPKASRIGKGTADARAGVNVSPNPPVLPFAVTAFQTGKKSIAFYLQQRNGDIVAVAPAKIKKARGKYGTRLDVAIPEEPAQQYPANNYNGLERLSVTLGSTRKNKSVVKTIGCKGKKHRFKAKVHFVPNPVPPTVGAVTTTASSKCR